MGIIGLVLIIISVAFSTLIERKVLGSSQNRARPDNLGFAQPISDGLKLLKKEVLAKARLGPSLGLVIGLSLTYLVLVIATSGITPISVTESTSYSLFILIVCLSASIIPISGVIWASASKYPEVRMVRAILQSLSYEFGLALILVVTTFN